MTTPARNPLIRVSHLSHTYPDGTLALADVTLDLNEGEFVGIIGQNGSGKTTLVKHFNGLLKPTVGEVLVDGVDITSCTVADLSRKVGYVFQNPDHQICQSTISDEVAFGPRNLKLSEEEVHTRVESALRAVRIEKLAQRHPLLVSKGERQRIAIASVIAMNPKILVVDEPTTGQDYVESKEIMDLLRKLNEDRHTVIVISHNMRLVAEYADRVIVFAQGKVLLDGKPCDVFSEEDLLKETLIRPPQIVRLMRMLSDRGARRGILQVEEACDEFKRLVGSVTESRL